MQISSKGGCANHKGTMEISSLLASHSRSRRRGGAGGGPVVVVL